PAKANLDFTPASGTLTFAADDGSHADEAKTFTISTMSDDLDEYDEQIGLSFTPSSGSVTGATYATITDDPNDLPPSYSRVATPSTVAEAGTPSATVSTALTAKLSAPSGKDVVVGLTSTNGTAVAPGDYASIPAMTSVTVPAGSLTSNSYTQAVYADGVK